MIYLPLFISFYKYDLSPFIYYILQYYLSPLMYYILHLLSPFLYHNTYFISLYLFKEYLKLLNRLCDITWFRSVYA